MRYHNLNSFEKHLIDSGEEHLCFNYLVGLADSYERISVMRSIRQRLPPHFLLWTFQGKLEALIQEVESFSLFDEGKIFWIDEIEQFSPQDLKIISSWIERGDPKIYWILGMKSASSFSSFVEEKGVVLDLLKEKPWDREKRLAHQVQIYIEKQGKQIAFDALAVLFEFIGCDLAALEQQANKLVCFIGDKRRIERTDVVSLVQPTQTISLWKWAEEVVWEKSVQPLSESLQAAIPSLRAQLVLGRKLHSLLHSQIPENEWGEYLPKMWPKTLEKRRQQVGHLSDRYFEIGLEILFEIETLSRSGSSYEEGLFDRFRMELSRI